MVGLLDKLTSSYKKKDKIQANKPTVKKPSDIQDKSNSSYNKVKNQVLKGNGCSIQSFNNLDKIEKEKLLVKIIDEEGPKKLKSIKHFIFKDEISNITIEKLLNSTNDIVKIEKNTFGLQKDLQKSTSLKDKDINPKPISEIESGKGEYVCISCGYKTGRKKRAKSHKVSTDHNKWIKRLKLPDNWVDPATDKASNS